jgi:hypothetical protein
MKRVFMLVGAVILSASGLKAMADGSAERRVVCRAVAIPEWRVGG